MARLPTALGMVLILLLFVVASAVSGGKAEPEHLEEAITLTYWTPEEPEPQNGATNLGDILMYRQMESRTGIRVEFVHPAQGQADVEFQLMVAAGSLPDIIETNWLEYRGGPEQAIQHDVIIPLNDLIEDHAPNFYEVLRTYPHIAKMVRTDRSVYYVFPCIGLSTLVASGLWLRADWLHELGLEPPRTIDQWTTTLRSLKEEYSLQAPLTFGPPEALNRTHFQGAFGVASGFYVEGSRVRYGPIEDGYRRYLELFRMWYEEGLIDPDFSIADGATKDYNVLSERSGAFWGWIGGDAGQYLLAKSDDPGFALVPAQYPVLALDDEPRFLDLRWNYRGEGAAAITTANRHPEETAAWFDYLYTTEGTLLKNFGVEGKTYEMVNGYPRYTDLILRNPDGLPVQAAMRQYFQANYPAPGIIDERYREQYFRFPIQKRAYSAFSKYKDNAVDVTLPPITPLPSESEEFGAITTEIEEYMTEYLVRFVLGQEPLESFDTYVAQLRRLGVDRAIEIQQGALERYRSR